MKTEITLLVLAAGRGSRYGSQKQFDEVGTSGEFLFEYGIYDAIQIGFDRIVIITSGESHYDISEYLTSRIPNHIYLKCVVQDEENIPSGLDLKVKRKKPWGTAHAVWTARDAISDSFVTVNADDYYGKEALKLAYNQASFIHLNNQYSLVGYHLQKTLSNNGTVSRGICDITNSQLTKIRERTQLTFSQGAVIDNFSGDKFNGDELVSMNLWVLTPLIFLSIEEQFTDFFQESGDLINDEIFLPSVIQSQIDNSECSVEVIKCQNQWMGLTYLRDKEQVSEKLKKYVDSGQYPVKLWPTQ